jgi:hypothetical protein
MRAPSTLLGPRHLAPATPLLALGSSPRLAVLLTSMLAAIGCASDPPPDGGVDTTLDAPPSMLDTSEPTLDAPPPDDAPSLLDAAPDAPSCVRCGDDCTATCSSCTGRTFLCQTRGYPGSCAEDVVHCDRVTDGGVRCPDGSVADTCGACPGGSSLRRCRRSDVCVSSCETCALVGDVSVPEPDSCGEACVDTQSDSAHCGGCGARCAVGLICTGGHCCEGLAEWNVDCGCCGFRADGDGECDPTERELCR